MKVKILILLVFGISLISCGEGNKERSKSINNDENLSLKTKIQEQYEVLNKNIEKRKDTLKSIPRTLHNEEVVLVEPYDWTSGFYPGSLWYLYELTGKEKWKDRAVLYTEKLDTIQYWEGNHDVGFIMECSYGNGIKSMSGETKKTKAYESIIVQTAESLSKRYRPKAGVLQSWEWNEKWDCPVIIDNMMNLELLFHATKISGDSTYYDIAVSHADTTLKNHFRENGSSFHVLDYDVETGEINQKLTHQGLNDESAWARGQAWGLYGYTMSYRETGDEKYLEQAKKIAEYLRNHDNMPEDLIPYWDFDVAAGKDVPRDASAAAIIASALYELQGFVEVDKAEVYTNWAEHILASLSSDKYFAKKGDNGGFILKHSVGSKPHGVEVDVPLNYADYYYLEALLRKQQIN